jgi:hypothetical protein
MIHAPRPNTTAVCCKNVPLFFYNTSNYVTKSFTFLIGMTAYNILYITCVAMSRYLTKPLTLNFGTFYLYRYQNIYSVVSVSLPSILYKYTYGIEHSRNLQFLSYFSCVKMVIICKFLSYKKLLDIQNVAK